jgi:hypothetical protein
MGFSIVKKVVNGLLAPSGYAIVNLHIFQQLLQQLKQKDKDLAKLTRDLEEKKAELEKVFSRATIRADLERQFEELK